jgi:hypothetical protein
MGYRPVVSGGRVIRFSGQPCRGAFGGYGHQSAPAIGQVQRSSLRGTRLHGTPTAVIDRGRLG